VAARRVAREICATPTLVYTRIDPAIAGGFTHPNEKE
jgi:hypothetical protein